MLAFLTITGSEYEIDQVNKKIRRTPSLTSGESDRVSTDWRPYLNISPIVIGESLIIAWANEVELVDGSPEYATPTTMTSIVLDVKEVPDPSTFN